MPHWEGEGFTCILSTYGRFATYIVPSISLSSSSSRVSGYPGAGCIGSCEPPGLVMERGLKLRPEDTCALGAMLSRLCILGPMLSMLHIQGAVLGILVFSYRSL